LKLAQEDDTVRSGMPNGRQLLHCRKNGSFIQVLETKGSKNGVVKTLGLSINPLHLPAAIFLPNKSSSPQIFLPTIF
uniref:hypothetical protein n=1 Tax=Stieleria sp. TaxID=2795976 RepID=UPI003566C41E